MTAPESTHETLARAGLLGTGELIDLASADWTVEAVAPPAAAPSELAGRRIPARVPGCVHRDLIDAGIIRHPDDGDAERTMQWIGRTDFRYQGRVALPTPIDAERIDLVCEGLDTVAEVGFDGQQLGRAANMFVPWRFELPNHLDAGEHEVTIDFRAPLEHGEALRAARGDRPCNGDWGHYNYLRKAAYTFGWDWGPMVAGCGIWRPIRIHAWNGARIVAVRPLVMHVDADVAHLHIVIDLAWANPDDAPRLGLVLRILDPDGRLVHEAGMATAEDDPPPAAFEHTVRIDAPRRWWPRDLGPPDRYRIDVALLGVESLNPIDAATCRVGLRSVTLDTTPDAADAPGGPSGPGEPREPDARDGAGTPAAPPESDGTPGGAAPDHTAAASTAPDDTAPTDAPGSRFVLRINDEPVFCRGANWIPCGPFPSEIDDHVVRTRVEQAAEANMNMLRVWGGGLYESEAFYEACDRAGIMVWQDVMLACATYPEEAPFPELIELEVRHHVARLARRPSVVLWCGGNENALAYHAWGWKEEMDPTLTWGERYLVEWLPAWITSIDPTRPYWPDSPWSGDPARHPNDPDHGDRHTWDVCFEEHRTIVPRFCSEVGHQSPPSIPTLKRAVGEDHLTVGDPQLEHRQRGWGGHDHQYGRHLVTRLGADDAAAITADFRRWHRTTQELQAEAMRLACAWHLQHRARCGGILIWQLNDVWAGHSWSLIDVDGHPKPAYFAVQQAFARGREADLRQQAQREAATDRDARPGSDLDHEVDSDELDG